MFELFDFTIEELLDLYKEEYLKAKTEGLTDAVAAERGWGIVCDYDPTLVGSGRFKKGDKRTVLASLAGGWITSIQIASGNYECSQKSDEDADTETNYLDMTWKDRYQSCADSGFIPFGRHLEPLIGTRKADQASTYVSILKTQLGYEFERGEFGWLTVEIPEPPKPEPIPPVIEKPEPPMLTAITTDKLMEELAKRLQVT